MTITTTTVEVGTATVLNWQSVPPSLVLSTEGAERMNKTTKSQILAKLNTEYALNLDPTDLVKNYDGEWTIDGMDPIEWCEAMTMD